MSTLDRGPWMRGWDSTMRLITIRRSVVRHGGYFRVERVLLLRDRPCACMVMVEPPDPTTGIFQPRVLSLYAVDTDGVVLELSEGEADYVRAQALERFEEFLDLEETHA